MEASLKWICWVAIQRNVIAKERKIYRNRRRSYKSLAKEVRQQNEYFLDQCRIRLGNLSKRYTKELRRQLKALSMRMLDNRDAGYSGILTENGGFISEAKMAEYAREYEAELALAEALK
jgi:hypothetical protein